MSASPVWAIFAVANGLLVVANFVERRHGEVCRILLPRTSVNKSRKKAEAAKSPGPLLLCGA